MNETDLRETYRQMAIGYEGLINYFYLDSQGNVTIGIGHCLHTENAALNLHMHDKETGLPANSTQIKMDYERVHSAQKNFKATYFKNLTQLRMETADVYHLFSQDFTLTIIGIRYYFPNFDILPKTVKLGLIDLAFNMGASKVHRFKNLQAAILKKNWKAAALESHRKNIDDARNNAIKALFLAANN